MDVITVDIYTERCHLQLNLPIFFERATLANIRKVFKLMTVEPWRNEETANMLKQFFPQWKKVIETELENSKIAEKAAASFVSTAQRQISCFGTMATKEMQQELVSYQRRLKSATRAVKRLNADLERCGKIINAYNKILGIKGD